MNHLSRGTVTFLLTISLLVLGANQAHGTVVESRNVAELCDLAELIFVGKVTGLSDGLDSNNLPHTTITFEVTQSIKGGLTEGTTFQYRQFGLLKGRPVVGSDTLLLVALIDGMPRYREGEETMVFLYKAAPLSGLRTAVGLAQGKFTIENGKLANVVNNSRLFDRMAIEESSLTQNETEMMSKKSGPVDAATFIGLVSKAISDNLFTQ